MSSTAVATPSSRPRTLDPDDVIPAIHGVHLPRARRALRVFLPSAVVTAVVVVSAIVTRYRFGATMPPDPAVLGTSAAISVALLVGLHALGRRATLPALVFGLVFFGCCLLAAVAGTEDAYGLWVGAALMVVVMIDGLRAHVAAQRLASAAGLDLLTIDGEPGV